jgi:Arc/MetJ family transcription regulator
MDIDKDLLSQYMRAIGAKGGRAAVDKRTPEERRAFALLGVAARREKARLRREAEEEALALVATEER